MSPKTRRQRVATTESTPSSADETPRRSSSRTKAKGKEEEDDTSTRATTAATSEDPVTASTSPQQQQQPATDDKNAKKKRKSVAIATSTTTPDSNNSESHNVKESSSPSRSSISTSKKSKKKRNLSEVNVNDTKPTPETPTGATETAMIETAANLDSTTTTTTTAPATAPVEETALITATTTTKIVESVVLPTKPAPTVDATVHRLRNLQYQPKPILCMAAQTTSSSSNDNDDDGGTCRTSFMAISRESGSVELQTVNPKLRTIAVVAGSAAVPITALTWTTATTAMQTNTLDSDDNNNTGATATSRRDDILIGASRGDLYVVDFWTTGQFVAKTPVAGGGIFCLQSLHSPSENNTFAVGCQDGSIRIFRVELEYKNDGAVPKQRYVIHAMATPPSAGAAILSLACQSNRTGMHVLFAGVADGTIRRYECVSSSAVAGGSNNNKFMAGSTTMMWKSTLRMTVECHGRNTPTRVWALLAASDGTVVSGDSLGHVQFWDGNTGTLLRSFDQNDSKADVFAMAMNSDETKVFASGVDSRVVCIERQVDQVNNSNNTSNHQWVLTHAQRPHTHDVKAVAIVKRFKLAPNGRVTKETEILCTGGIDTKLCTYYVPEFGVRRPRATYPWPSLKSPIVAANEGRILAMLREDRVDLYDLAASPERQTLLTPHVVPDDDTLIGTVQVKGSANLSCCAISNNGEFLALSDTYSLLLFHLGMKPSIKNGIGRRSVDPSKIPLKLPRIAAVTAMNFVQNNFLIVAASDGRIHEISIGLNSESILTGTVASSVLSSSEEFHQSSLLPIHAIFGSSDGNWFATLRNSSNQGDGKVDVYRRNGSVDNFRFWWTLPSLGTAITAAAFTVRDDATLPPLLAVACINYSLYVFDVSEKRLSKWSEKAGHPLHDKLPVDLVARTDFPVRIGINPASPALVMMGSFGALVAIKTDVEFPRHCRIFPESHVRAIAKRKRSRSLSEQLDVSQPPQTATSSSSCTMCLRYNSMLFMNFVGDDELVIVEQPWLSVVAGFPEALQRRVYGT